MKLVEIEEMTIECSYQYYNKYSVYFERIVSIFYTFTDTSILTLA